MESIVGWIVCGWMVGWLDCPTLGMIEASVEADL